MSLLLALAVQAAAPSAVPTPAPGPAPTSATTASADSQDLRCVALLSVALNAAADDGARAGVTAGMMYFVGRIDGRTPRFDFETELVRVSGDPTLAADRERCGGQLRTQGAALQALGATLQARGAGN